MIEKVDSPLQAAPLVRPIERVGGAANAAMPKADLVPAPAAVAPMPAYDFQFRVNRETDEITAVIVDPETRAVIREIPSEEMRAASDVIRNLIGPRINKIV